MHGLGSTSAIALGKGYLIGGTDVQEYWQDVNMQIKKNYTKQRLKNTKTHWLKLESKYSSHVSIAIK